MQKLTTEEIHAFYKGHVIAIDCDLCFILDKKASTPATHKITVNNESINACIDCAEFMEEMRSMPILTSTLFQKAQKAKVSHYSIDIIQWDENTTEAEALENGNYTLYQLATYQTLDEAMEVLKKENAKNEPCVSYELREHDKTDYSEVIYYTSNGKIVKDN